MSTIHSGPPDPPGEPTDTGEFRSQQNVTLGWVAVVEQIIHGNPERPEVPSLRTMYAPEVEIDGQRTITTWKRGGVDGAPVVGDDPPGTEGNYFIGEQYITLNYSPQTIVFARAPVPILSTPTPMIGYHRTGYKQIYNAIYTIQTRVWAFDDDDAQELFNYIVAATYVQTVGSALGSVWENLTYAPKRPSTRGTVMEFGLKVGVPVFLPPLTPARPCFINQRTAICRPTSDT